MADNNRSPVQIGKTRLCNTRILQEFDWEDISRIRTANEYSVRVDRETTRVGKLAMKDETMVIDDGSSVPVEQYGLISIAPGAVSELSNWTSKVTLSSSLRSGSTQQKDVSLRAVVQRRTESGFRRH